VPAEAEDLLAFGFRDGAAELIFGYERPDFLFEEPRQALFPLPGRWPYAAFCTLQ
jgi:hypothetical protein